MCDILEVFYMSVSYPTTVKQFICDVVADGCIIGDNPLGIVERNGDFPIVPKNLVVSFDHIDTCENGFECQSCKYGGCCNNIEIEIATVSKIGGKQKIRFQSFRGYQIGSIWTKWVRTYYEKED